VDSVRYEILKENMHSNEHTVIQMILSVLVKLSYRDLSINQLWSHLQNYTNGEYALQNLDKIKKKLKELCHKASPTKCTKNDES
jgi:predicted ATP-dependent Lon-type protease